MSKVPVVPPLRADEIEDRAKSYLVYYYPEVLQNKCAVPVDAFFENVVPELVRMTTYYTDLQQLGIAAEGYTNAEQRISIVDKHLSDNFTELGRRRFRATVGHETGHCILHVPARRWQASLQAVGRGMKREDSLLKPYENPEWQAWRFCHAFCMPRSCVQKMVTQYGTDNAGINALIEHFDLNYTFVMARLKMLKIMSR